MMDLATGSTCESSLGKLKDEVASERSPLVGVVADTRTFDNYEWHAAPAIYLSALVRHARATPIIIPALGGEVDIARCLDPLDGVLLTGSRSNVHPEQYGVSPTPAHEPFDTQRDATALPVIRLALDRGLPLFAICRGIQELNVALGGSIAAELHALSGRMDHRAPDSGTQDERFAIRHAITARSGGVLQHLIGAERIAVNSVHRQGIDRLAPGLDIEATAEDGTIEAVRVRDAKAFAMGVQWHPEYWAGSDAPSTRLFKEFGAALRGEDIAARAAAE